MTTKKKNSSSSKKQSWNRKEMKTFIQAFIKEYHLSVVEKDFDVWFDKNY